MTSSVARPRRSSKALQFSSGQLLSHVRLSETRWTAAHQASQSITYSWSLLKLINPGMPSNHLILCHPLLLLPSIFPSIEVFSNESVLHIRWLKYWSFSFRISSSNEYSELISFQVDWFDLHEVQGTVKGLLQHYSSKASILQYSACLMVQLLHPYITTGKTPDKLAPKKKKRPWSLFGGLLKVQSLQLSESPGNHYFWEIYSANQWDTPKTAIYAVHIGQYNGPNSCPRQCPTAWHTTNSSKIEQIGLQSFASATTFSKPLANRLPLQASRQFFAGKTLPKPAGGRNTFQELVKSWSMDFYAIGINKLISHWKNCVAFNGP